MVIEADVLREVSSKVRGCGFLDISIWKDLPHPGGARARRDTFLLFEVFHVAVECCIACCLCTSSTC